MPVLVRREQKATLMKGLETGVETRVASADFAELPQSIDRPSAWVGKQLAASPEQWLYQLSEFKTSRWLSFPSIWLS
jgi:hypothetical protein